MNTRSSLIAICLAVGFSTVATSSQAGWFDRYKARASQRSAVPAAVPAPAAQASVSVPQQHTPSLPSAKYPNGTGWRAIENDFIDVKARIDVVEGKVDDVKADTVSILSELDDVDADHVMIKAELADIKDELDDVDADHATIMDKLDTINTELGDVASEVLDVADDVATLKNTLQIQVSVEPKSASDRNEVNDAPVGLFVQVTQNGVGVVGLTENTLVFSNSFPTGGAVYCGAACFIPGADGMYRIELAGDWVVGAYAGTLKVQDGSSAATGTSMVTFEIPAEPAAP